MEINAELKEKMLEYLQQFESGIKSAADFSAEQAPLVVQEYLAWQFWMCSAVSVVAAAGCLLLVVLIQKLRKCSDGVDKEMVGMFGSIGVAVLLVVCVLSGFSAAKVAVAPRVVVLEKIHDLVK